MGRNGCMSCRDGMIHCVYWRVGVWIERRRHKRFKNLDYSTALRNSKRIYPARLALQNQQRLC